jgi:hypothetical protein
MSADAFIVEDIGGACPTQATGRYTESDRPFYFRARHGVWTLQVGEPGWPTDYCDWPEGCPELAPIANGDDPTEGWMESEDVLAIIAANVPPVVVEGEVVVFDLPAGVRGDWEQMVAEAKSATLRRA